MGQLVLSVAGAAIGAYFGGPIGASVGFELGSLAGGAIFPKKVDSPTIPPTLMQRSAYGMMLPIGQGAFRCAGNVIWEGGITATQSNSSQGKGGPTVVTTSYSATFACSICDCAASGPIEGIRRIWMNGQLVYDVSGTASTATLAASGTFAANNMVVYTGTGTQNPDPTIQAALGVGNVPGYRYTAYVVFIDLPLQAFGDTIPVVNFEVVFSGNTGLTQVFETLMTTPTWVGSNFRNASATAPIPIILGVNSGLIGVADRIYGANTYAGSLGDGLVYSYSIVDGHLVKTEAQTDYSLPVQTWSSRATNWSDSYQTSSGPGGSHALVVMWNTDGNAVIATNYAGTGSGRLVVNSAYPTTGVFVVDLWTLVQAQPGFNSSDFVSSAYPCADYKHVLAISSGSGGAVKFALIDTTGSGAVVNSGLMTDTLSIDGLSPTNTGGQGASGSAQNNGNTQPGASPALAGCLQSDLKTFWLIAAFRDSNHSNSSTGVGCAQLLVYQMSPGVLQIVAGLTDSTLVTPAGTPAFPASNSFTGSVPYSIWADQGFAAIIAGQELTLWSFGSLANISETSLGAICTTLAEAVGVPSGNIDVTHVSSVPVWGMLIENQGQLRRTMEALAPTFWFDMVESDTKLSFRQRSATPVFTIPFDDMGAVEDDKPNDSPLVVTLVDDLTLPKQVDVAYYNVGADYQIGGQYARALTSNSTQRTSISAAAVMSDQDAANAAAVILWDARAGRLQFEFSTSLKWGQVEPTDVGYLVDTNITYLARITDKTEQGNTIKWKAVGCAPVYNQNVSPGIITPTPQDVPTTGTTTLLLLDLPPLRDQDGNTATPYLYVAMIGQDSNWRGATLFKSNDGGASWVAQLSSTLQSGIGVTTTALNNWTGGNFFDEFSSVTINLETPGGSFSSASALAVLNGANLCLIGNELVQFKTATLLGGSSWKFTGFLRGRIDTEPYMTGHSIGENFVLLSFANGAPANLNIETEGLPDIGATRMYQAVTTGSALGSGAEQSLVSKGENLVCFYPCFCNSVKSGTGGDIQLFWTRRNRITWQWLENVDVPMSEATESYVVSIYNGSTVVRTITVAGTGIDTASVVYTAAQQVTDFGSAQTTLKWGVAQVSAVTGAGNQTIQTQTPV